MWRQYSTIRGIKKCIVLFLPRNEDRTFQCYGEDRGSRLEARHLLATIESMHAELLGALFSGIGNVEYGSKQLKLNPDEAIMILFMSESEMSKHKKNMCWNFQEMNIPVDLSDFSTVAHFFYL
jgi:hypothetical protein